MRQGGQSSGASGRGRDGVTAMLTGGDGNPDGYRQDADFPVATEVFDQDGLGGR